MTYGTAIGITFAGYALLCSGAASAQPRCQPVSYELTPKAALVSLRCLLADSLREPGSASYRGVFLTKTTYVDGRQPPWDWMLCGEMNARNGYGGMTGWTGFAFSPGASVKHPLHEQFFSYAAYCSAKAEVIAGSR